MISGKYTDSLVDIQERWSMRDLLDAHDVLDLYERIEQREMSAHRREMERMRARGGRR